MIALKKVKPAYFQKDRNLGSYDDILFIICDNFTLKISIQSSKANSRVLTFCSNLPRYILFQVC